MGKTGVAGAPNTLLVTPETLTVNLYWLVEVELVTQMDQGPFVTAWRNESKAG